MKKLMKMIIGRAKRAPHWGVQSRFRVIYIYMLSVCRMSVVCQINCVGGITCGQRACSKSFFLAVKPVTPARVIHFLYAESFSMDEKEAEARPVMGTIFLVIIVIIMNKSQELTIFHGRQKLTSAKN